VETEEERLKLMFRIKARIDRALLEKHIRDVKTGLPGVACWPPFTSMQLESDSTSRGNPQCFNQPGKCSNTTSGV
jgi:hypothetical protein